MRRLHGRALMPASRVAGQAPNTTLAVGAAMGAMSLAAGAHVVGEGFMVGWVIAVTALGSAFLVPAGEARDLAAARAPAAPSRC